MDFNDHEFYPSELFFHLFIINLLLEEIYQVNFKNAKFMNFFPKRIFE